MSKILNIAGWIGGFILMIVLLAFSSNCRDHTRIEGIQVAIDFDSGSYFVTAAEVEEIVRENYPFLDSLYCKEININLLEERLDNHPSIRKAEVYSALDGVLRISVKQKKPVFRVQSSRGGYYVDEEGDSMALSTEYTARVPLVTGMVDPENRRKIFEFVQELKQQAYFADFIDGLHVDEDSSWILYPRPGHHKVYLGKPLDLANKMNKLRIFYENVVNTENLESISSLNLAFKQQVVCTKR